MSNPLHIAFDLGSFSIKGAVGRVNQNEELEILSIQAIQSESVECGTIVDKERLREDLEYLIDRIEKEAKININKVPFRIPSGLSFVKINPKTGLPSNQEDSILEPYLIGTEPFNKNDLNILDSLGTINNDSISGTGSLLDN